MKCFFFAPKITNTLAILCIFELNAALFSLLWLRLHKFWSVCRPAWLRFPHRDALFSLFSPFFPSLSLQSSSSSFHWLLFLFSILVISHNNMALPPLFFLWFCSYSSFASPSSFSLPHLPSLLLSLSLPSPPTTSFLPSHIPSFVSPLFPSPSFSSLPHLFLLLLFLFVGSFSFLSFFPFLLADYERENWRGSRNGKIELKNDDEGEGKEEKKNESDQ